MKKALIYVMLLIITSSLFSQITCNQFDVNWSIDGDKLKILLMTDLPDYTELILSVSRTYILKSNNERYSVDYYSEKLSVKHSKTTKTININSDFWMQNFNEDLKTKTAFGMGSQYKDISNYINIRVIIPARQWHPSFGEKNINLMGKMVTTGSFGKYIEFEASYNSPLNKKINAPIHVNAQSLEIHKLYLLPRSIPLMPEFDPKNPISAIDKVIKLNIGDKIKIIDIKYKNNKPWYNVKVLNINKIGWINSSALLGSIIKEV